MNRFQSSFVIFILVLFIGLTVIPSSGLILINEPSKINSILYVGGSGPGNHSKIQDAVDNASDGYTIYVYDDSSPYYENITIYKQIKLIGENKNTTVIDGNYFGGAVVGFNADGISISGFTIQNSGDKSPYLRGSGVLINTDGNLIINNIIVNNDVGIRLWYQGSNNIIQKNNIIYNRFGIFINDISERCYNNLFTKNIIAHNKGAGILDSDEKDGTIASWNVIADNGKIYPLSCDDGGVSRIGSYSVYHHNDFFFNRVNADVYGGRYGNEWDDGSEGNFWDDWESNPGHPDTYIIPCQFSEEIDHFPSPTPYSNSFIVGQSEGHYYALIDEPIEFIADTTEDPYSVSWFWEFGDGETSYEINPTHSYNSTGFYQINVTISDNQGRSDTSKSEAQIGRAPNNPTITGPTMGTIGVRYNYTIVTADPDGDDVYYDIEWGDRVYNWDVGPYVSGEEVIFNHSWYDRGFYCIMVKAQDTSGLESDWTVLEVVIPRNKATYNSLLFNILERFPILRNLISIYK